MATSQGLRVKIRTPENRVIHSSWHWFRTLAKEQNLPYYVIGQIEKKNQKLIEDLIGKVYIVEQEKN